MNAIWQQFLGAAGARLGTPSELIGDFGDPSAELAAARDATVVVPLTHLGMIDCAGDDAKSFLHNQLTSDINHLGVDAAQHSAWCTAKGRMVASFLIFRVGGDYRLLLSQDLLAATQKRLQMYVLRSKVKLADVSGDYALLGVSGPRAEEALQAAALPVPGALLTRSDFSDGTVMRVNPTPMGARFVVVCRTEAAPAVWQALSATAVPAGTPAWRWLDVCAGIPLITEATKEAFVPQMADFDKIGGVSFQKGCYPGQEIVARTHYLGKVKRHLYRIHAATAVEAGMDIHEPENPELPCGTIANAALSPDGGYDALAVIQETFVESGGLTLGAPDGPSFSIIAPVSPAS